jgi:hypothetical protein
MKRLATTSPTDADSVADQLDRDINALVLRAGGREALLQRLTDSSSLAVAEPSSETDRMHRLEGAGAAASRSDAVDFLVRLRLEPEELRRLDEASQATRFTRNRWIANLIRTTLYGRPQQTTIDRVNISLFVKELRKIEASSQKSARALAELEATARACVDRLRQVDQFREQVKRMADALDEVFKGNDSYWNRLITGEHGEAAAHEDESE